MKTAVLLLAAFVGLGSLWIDRPGLRYDETHFVLATWPRNDIPLAYVMHFKGRPVALMVNSYFGALKGWIYVPILRIWAGSAATVRVPTLLLGAAGLWFFYLFVRRALGSQTALA